MGSVIRFNGNKVKQQSPSTKITLITVEILTLVDRLVRKHEPRHVLFAMTDALINGIEELYRGGHLSQQEAQMIFTKIQREVGSITNAGRRT